ncbi:hypothetical protein E3Q22_00508 [Wallemia mellicola]|uniref:Uncharacterized protein n=1 Tax=Wallemia mellicola TaxID=1708541 RepID=A0A4T0QBX7_9BASI|nr:hypothetical protein E3Q23_04116 [Wallemia mellicola]TIB82039.1 hypothetical protein E3Q22_00508 [Wallemia mellicola]TIB87738.1 hypothetical protein E3Q21_01273 [Wallemia mellicola]TIB89229.1 hypothetical protein E3Q19_03112 [Wallemia mellicola]TIB90575.1 hypothetical protein E3Q20_01260 [Wallemia mellicola]
MEVNEDWEEDFVLNQDTPIEFNNFMEDDSEYSTSDDELDILTLDQKLSLKPRASTESSLKSSSSSSFTPSSSILQHSSPTTSISDFQQSDDDDFLQDIHLPQNINFHSRLLQKINKRPFEPFEQDLDISQDIKLSPTRIQNSLLARASSKKPRSSAPAKVTPAPPVRSLHRRGSLSSLPRSPTRYSNQGPTQPSLRNAKSTFNFSQSRLTAPTASSLAKSKPAKMRPPSISIPAARVAMPSSAKLLTKPKNLKPKKIWGDGSELEAFEDLTTQTRTRTSMSGDEFSTIKARPSDTRSDRSSSPSGSTIQLFNTFFDGRSRSPQTPPPPPTISQSRYVPTRTARAHSPITIPIPNSTVTAPTLSSEAKRKQRLHSHSSFNRSLSPTSSQMMFPSIHQRTEESFPQKKTLRRSKRPTLIKQLGKEDQVKVVGDMKYNPVERKWDGNNYEPALRELETSRPATTTPNSSFNSLRARSPNSSGNGTSYLNQPTKIVGDMVFDPVRMCWLTNDEEDVFANLSSSSNSSRGSHYQRDQTAMTIFHHDTNNSQVSTIDTERAKIMANIPKELIDQCEFAEKQHDNDIQGWIPRGGIVDDRRYLYEIYVMSKKIAARK